MMVTDRHHRSPCTTLVLSDGDEQYRRASAAGVVLILDLKCSVDLIIYNFDDFHLVTTPACPGCGSFE